MQQVMYLFPLLLGFVLILGASTALIAHFKKNNKPSWTMVTTGLTAVVLMFVMYKGIYRPFGLYENHFKQATTLTFPSSGNYVFADTWIDDAESDGYSSIALIEFDPSDIQSLKNQLKAMKYSPVSDSIKIKENFDDRLEYVLALSKSKDIVEEYGLIEQRLEKRNGTMFKIDRIRYYFGFLNDDRTVVAYIISK